MISFFKKSIFIVVLTGSWQQLCSQPFADSGIAGFLRKKPLHFREKIYVRTDKANYVAGETVWFKLYNVDGYNNKPLSFEKIAYVEILSSNQKAVLQTKIELNDGMGNGFLVIPFSFSSGPCILRAYTSWMRNFSTSLFYEQRLTVINTLKKPDWETLEQAPRYHLQFFPEGGDLVEGLESIVGFKITDQFGKGINAVGKLISNDGDTINTFKTLRFGLGTFSFIPAAGKTYKAILSINGDTTVTNLPKAKTTGMVLHLSSHDSDHLNINVGANNDQVNETVYLVLQTRHLLKSISQQLMHNGRADFTVNLDSLGEGISQFTLYNANYEPVCERLYFKQPANKLSIHVSAGEAVYQKRKQGVLTVKFPGKVDLQDGVSLSIARVDSLQVPPDADIQSYLWLSSDIGGFIESSAYYFSASAERRIAADNLMLTQGWRKFIIDSTYFNTARPLKFLAETEGPLVTGKVISKENGRTVPNIETYLSSPGEVFQFRNATSDSIGIVRYAFKNNPGNDQMIFQPGPDQIKNVSIAVENPYDENPASVPLAPFSLNKLWQKQLEIQSLNVQSQHIYLKEHNYLLYPERTDSFQFYGKPDRTYYLEDYTRFITMDEVMREIVAEAKVRKQAGGFLFEVKNNVTNTFFTGRPLVMIDGVPVFDLDKVMALDPLKIMKIDVVAKKYFVGGNDYNGLISYSTYNGDLSGYALPGEATVVRFNGPQLKRQFYTPQYSQTAAIAKHSPDFRTILLWEPAAASAKAIQSVPFYTSDVAGTYIVTAEGITPDGVCGSSHVYFTVE